ncbi:MAG: PilZ domain-containing protein [Bdellovibrionales bacterium]|nr:PilZ domain-containing protein [Bdellovibrionales bacterium]
MKPLSRQKLIERRSKSRVEAKMRMRIHGEFEEIRVFHGNISKTGMYLESPDIVATLGDRIHLELFMPDTEQLIKLRGKIVRITQANQLGASQGLAVQFFRIDQKYIKLLDQYINQLFGGKGIGCRKSPRMATHVLVEVKKNDATYEAVADNLGRGGLFLRIPSQKLQIGDLVNLVILHPSSRRRFFVDSEIVHIRTGVYSQNPDFEEGIGVRFINLTKQRREDFVSFLKSILHYQRRSNS